MASQNTTRRGFTLVEILTVVAILAVAGAIVAPTLLRSGHMTVQAAGRMVIQDLLFAQNEAIAQQSPRRLVFESSQNRYKLTDGNGVVLGVVWKGENAGSGNYVVDFSADGRFAGVQIENVNFGSEGYIEFDDLGVPNRGGTVDLTAHGYRYRVTVAEMTGRVTIAPVEAE